MITGYGTFTYHDDGRYEGYFVSGSYQGHGTISYANGNRYEDEFKGGMPNGHGTFRTNTGEMLTGNWSNGCFRQGARVAAVGI